MKQPRTLDEARVLYPRHAFYLNAEPGGDVWLEIVDEDGNTQAGRATTETEAWALAFPATEVEPVDPPVSPPTEQMQREAAAASPTPIGLFD